MSVECPESIRAKTRDETESSHMIAEPVDAWRPIQYI
jgi:hypothetical protein